jgi:Na+/proline symporter
MSSYYILLILLCYIGVLFIISFITGKKEDDNKAFFLGNKTSPWFVVAFGMIGTSLSGVSFISVPGMARSLDMTYMQTVFGFFFGYLIVAQLLLPLYYRLNLTSIYTYLKNRIGEQSYKTGAVFFIISKITGAAARLYLVTLILQVHVFDTWNVPFAVTVILTILLIWLYTYRGGLKTIVWTDMVQTCCLLSMLVLIIWSISEKLDLDFNGMVQTVTSNPHFSIFEFDWFSSQNFFKQFISGIFITIVMTGLDQDMMQKNLSCRSLRDAQKNMYFYGFAFAPVNFLFLCLGILLLVLGEQEQVTLPVLNDEILPFFATSGILNSSVLVFFTIGIIAAAFSSADSALTSLTTSVCVDLLNTEDKSEKQAKKSRIMVHISISVLFAIIILIFKAVNNKSVIDAIYIIASYTYGPLLGLFSFGLFTKCKPIDRYVPYICVASPFITYGINHMVTTYTDYRFGYEILILNGLITCIGLWMLSIKHNKHKIQ